MIVSAPNTHQSTFMEMDIRIQAAIIASIFGIISSIVTIYFKRKSDKWLFKYKIDEQHKHEQQKLIKASIAQNKIQLINAAEELNHRLWNLISNHKKNWHSIDGSYGNDEKYYFNSFVFRLANFLWWVDKSDNDLDYFDTTIAEDSELNYVKYVRFFKLIMCQTTLFKGMDYDDEYAVDHFFKHELEDEILSFTQSDEPISYSQYLTELHRKHHEMRNLCQFLNGIQPDEERLRWIRLFVLHLSIVSFLNIYGYDFQKTNIDKSKEIIAAVLKHKNGNIGLSNYKEMVKRIHLNEEPETKKILNLIKA